MDRLIKRFEALADDDLMVCAHRGVAYQRNMARGRIAYDAGYFGAYQAFSGSGIEQALNAGRCAMVARHAGSGTSVLDVGIGNGSFLRAALACGYEARGLDVNPVAIEWLKAEKLLATDVRDFDVVTFWDSLEHIEEPESALQGIKKGAVVLVALPVFDDIGAVRASKHYKPGEHLYYWTPDGFVSWMALYGFRLLERSDHEVSAGREAIGAFAFRRDLPDYEDHIEAYKEMHFSRFYGSSATELHLDRVAGVVRERKPRSILDFGCGRSDLVAHFWRDGERRIARYDPAIRPFRRLPEGLFDLALCCDVMEHIPMASVDRVLAELRSRAKTALFTISTRLARAKLPDGRNAHVTILTDSEWTRWVKSVFGRVRRLPSDDEHELVLLAGEGA